MVFELLSILLAFFLVLLVQDLLEEDIGNTPTFRSVFKLVLLMFFVALAIAFVAIPGFYMARAQSLKRKKE